MSKDLVRKSEIAKPDNDEDQIEQRVDKAAHALAELMLFGAESRPQPVQDRLVSFSRSTARARWASSSRSEG